MAAPYGAVPASGSFVNLDKVSTAKGRGVSFHAQSLGFLAAPPILLFTAMDLTFAFLSGKYLPLALVIAAAGIAFSMLFFAIGRAHVKGPIYTFVSVVSFIATAAGIASGLSIQANFYGPYVNYRDRPAYTNVLATDIAAARADAGIINFADNAVVDTMRSGQVLSSHGNRFCVAPILDESQHSRAEYWAVGLDCCTGRVGFYCDDAQDITAKTGAVVFDMDSFSNDPYSRFVDAVKQAGARNQLQLPDKPVLVRWVKDSATVTEGLWRDGSTHLGVGILVYAAISALVAMGLHAATNRRK